MPFVSFFVLLLKLLVVAVIHVCHHLLQSQYLLILHGKQLPIFVLSFLGLWVGVLELLDVCDLRKVDLAIELVRNIVVFHIIVEVHALQLVDVVVLVVAAIFEAAACKAAVQIEFQIKIAAAITLS